jgi:hypothetical protein
MKTPNWTLIVQLLSERGRSPGQLGKQCKSMRKRGPNVP